MTEDEIIQAVGVPNSEMGRGSKEIFLYSGGSLELRMGRLNSADGFKMDYMAPDGVSQFTYATGQGWTLNGEPVDSSFRFTKDEYIAPIIEPTDGLTVYSAGDDSLPAPAESTPEADVPPTAAEPQPQADNMAEQDYEDEYYDEYYEEDYEYEPLADFDLEPADKTYAIAFWSLTALVLLSVIASFIVAR